MAYKDWVPFLYARVLMNFTPEFGSIISADVARRVQLGTMAMAGEVPQGITPEERDRLAGTGTKWAADKAAARAGMGSLGRGRRGGDANPDDQRPLAAGTAHAAGDASGSPKPAGRVCVGPL